MAKNYWVEASFATSVLNAQERYYFESSDEMNKFVTAAPLMGISIVSRGFVDVHSAHSALNAVALERQARDALITGAALQAAGPAKQLTTGK